MHNLAGPLLVTLGYILFYYVAVMNVTRVKAQLRREASEKGERFDRYLSQDKRMVAADRIQLNTLEHMPPFLALLWLVAVFASAQHATIAGGVYLASRCAYPLVLGARVGGDAPLRIMPFTFAGYLVLGFFWVDLALTVLRQG